MISVIRFAVVVLLVIVSAGAREAVAQDVAGASDYPLVGRFQGARIIRYTDTSYEAFYFPRQPIGLNEYQNPDANSDHAEGHLIRIQYEGPEGVSALETMRNYEAKLASEGFEVVFSCRREACGFPPHFYRVANQDGRLPQLWETQHYIYARLDTPQHNLWVSIHMVEGGGGNRPLRTFTAVNVIEAAVMQTDQITVLEADALAEAIARDGRIAIYGIYFDFDSATLQPESQPQIDQLGALMQANPALNVLIVGHTDGRGAFDYNLSLSQRRAQSVVDAVVRGFGIPASRMTPAGAGMVAPVASNRTEEGRARNRRVEIVERVE